MNLSEQFEKYADLIPKVEPRERGLYERHFAFLSDWNTRMALVSRKSIEFSFGSHYADSLFLSETARPYTDRKVFDLGTGAGFPGTIFAIRYPEKEVVLFERSTKKQKFLSALIEELKLVNVTLRDEPSREPHEGLFFARAVMPREELLEYMLPRLAGRSLLITSLGSDKKDLPVPPGFLKILEKEYTLPLDQGARRAEVIQKVPRGTK